MATRPRSPEHERRAFGQRLKALLDGQEIRPSEMARRLGSNDSSVSRYLSGEHEPTLATLGAIREALRCSWGDLLGGDEAISREQFEAGYEHARADAVRAVRGMHPS
jgi:transcriptional regulator with XRE-family HTH domain